MVADHLYTWLVYYPAFVAFHTGWYDSAASQVELLRSYQTPLLVAVGLALASTMLLVLAIHAAFAVCLKQMSTRFVAQFKAFLVLPFVVVPGIAWPVLGLILLIRAKSGASWNGRPLVETTGAISLVAALAITALSFSCEPLSWDRIMVNAHCFALASALLALLGKSLERPLVAPYWAALFLLASWICVTIWVWQKGSEGAQQERSTDPATS
ncbi:MAG: hypothetical protein ACHQQS_03310 [Thermoanaerobaculales bacterium]